VANIVRLQPGVVTSGPQERLSIRGGRAGEEAIFIDGVLVRNFNAGRSSLTIGTNSLSEVDVLTGGFSAEYGEAQSGIINYVRRRVAVSGTARRRLRRRDDSRRSTRSASTAPSFRSAARWAASSASSRPQPRPARSHRTSGASGATRRSMWRRESTRRSITT
jgi:hypothetical protein